MSTWAVSDLHGNYELFLAILDAINPKDTVYFLGDACDRGPDGYDLMKSIWQEPNWIYLMGNHEDMFLDAVDDYIHNGCWMYESYAFSVRNGGFSTLSAWEYDGEAERQMWYRRFSKLPMSAEYINTKEQRIFLCHCGFTPVMNKHTKKIEMYQSAYRLLWDRDHMSDYRWPAHMENIYVVHGHTPIQSQVHNYTVDQGPLFYQGLHKIDIDCASYTTNAALIFNLDTFDHLTVRV